MNPENRLYEVHQRPELDQPALMLAPDGWIDAGLAGAGAMAALLKGIGTELVASFDTDEFIDYRARRPMSIMEDGVYEELNWPKIEMRAGHDDEGHDVLVLVGPEPDSRWKAFTGAVAELAGMFGVRLLVGMAGFPAPVPHTRTAPLAASASSTELALSIGVVPGILQVPAGILAALGERLGDVGVPTIGLWARVPHYAAGMPYPDASIQLLDGLSRVIGLKVEVAELREAAGETHRRLDELAANSAQHRTLIRQLETQFDAEAENQSAVAAGWANLPTGDELAAELEKFLRDQ
ncbi:MAG TPA: PAC2 family protein [Acidimicrobiales bacterium]|nr:PAC2 family protein [Acidimicrobiales bacterium]